MPVSLVRGRWHRVRLQSRVGVDDGMGGETTTWTDVDTVWARIGGAGEREVLQAEALQAKLTHAVTIRHRRDVDPTMRVLFGTRTFAIHGVRNPDERNESMTLLCEEGAAT